MLSVRADDILMFRNLIPIAGARSKKNPPVVVAAPNHAGMGGPVAAEAGLFTAMGKYVPPIDREP